MVSEQPPAEATAAATGPAAGTARPRGRQTVGDMLRSLLVVLALVFLAVALSARSDSGLRVRPVDYGSALAAAREQAPYDVLAPVGLPSGWTATSARVGRAGDAITWHLGFVTPTGTYAGLDQGDGRAAAVVDTVARDARAAGTTTVGGLRWRRLAGGQPEPRALVLEAERVTTVVAGGASWAELRTLARALTARRGMRD